MTLKEAVSADGSGENPAPLGRAALDGVFGFRLRRLQGMFVHHWSRWFRAHELSVTPVQGGIILLIRDNPGLTQVALARLLQVEAPTLMQALNPLIAMGYVVRDRSLQDRRALEFRLSEEGDRAAAIVSVQITRHERDILAGLSERERATFYTLLEKALASAEDAVTATK